MKSLEHEESRASQSLIGSIPVTPVATNSSLTQKAAILYKEEINKK